MRCLWLLQEIRIWLRKHCKFKYPLTW